MTQDGARAWLPKDAFSLEAISACLSGPIVDWSRRWFACAPAAIAAVRGEVGLSQAPTPDRLTIGVSAALEISGRGKRHLLEAALDADLSEQPLMESDRRLLDAFFRKLIDDLSVTLDNIFRDDIGSAVGPLIVVTIAIGEVEVMTLEAPESAFVPLIKECGGGPSTGSRPVARRGEALRKTQLRVRGYLGRAEIGIGDLEALSAGDVLILDRLLAEPIDLRPVGSTVPVARGRLCRSADGISLQL